MSETNQPVSQRDFVGYRGKPPNPHWPNGARVAVSLVVNFEEVSEFSVNDGDAGNEAIYEVGHKLDGPDSCIDSHFEYGTRAAWWRIMDLFDAYGVKATVSSCGRAIERSPELARDAIARGHEVSAHGWRWQSHADMDEASERTVIAKTVAAIERVTGQRPVGWHTRSATSANTRRLLVEEGGFLYDSDAYNDDLPYDVQVGGKDHLVLPYSLTYNDIKFVLPEGFGGPSAFVDYCNRGIDELLREGETVGPRMMSIGLHSRLVGQAARTSALREVIEHALSKDGVRISRRCDIARWCWDHRDDFEPSRSH